MDAFLLPPGSTEAREVGCICDVQDEQDDADARERVYRVEKACPVHGLGELKARLDE